MNVKRATPQECIRSALPFLCSNILLSQSPSPLHIALRLHSIASFNTMANALHRITGLTGRGTLPVYESLPDDVPSSRRSRDISVELPADSATSHDLTSCPTVSSSSSTFVLDEEDSSVFPSQYHPSDSRSKSGAIFGFTMPSLRTFLSNFTLGFADGLTVPFALTAGLSSLGQTNTVIYAGMAEICAGSISMGIGGYLAARGEQQQSQNSPADQEQRYTQTGGDEPGEESEAGMESKERLLRDAKSCDPEKNPLERGAIPDSLARYLAPLRLSPELEEQVWTQLRLNGYDGDAISDLLDISDGEDPRGGSPIIEGLSVSVGYLVGGILPLFPYFFVSDVNVGLLGSFVVCVIALFVFGFGKHYALNTSGMKDGERQGSWPRIKSSLWEGFQMVTLGSIAALAAVLCVKLFDNLI
ncbi:VIT family-domain-containing protein [Echria macrotheca]|uniref:VIT family-domain-containing protein n=1 Tax=Echria macrotheca TaxID=438768 RepID=A0AAJ0B9C0_9PEZI|nr:VIT family-domain-containing protein [Echria macrotheca]